MKGKPKKLLLGVLVLVQVVSAVLAWRDLASRSNDEVRGSKKAWRPFIVLNPGISLCRSETGLVCSSISSRRGAELRRKRRRPQPISS